MNKAYTEFLDELKGLINEGKDPVQTLDDAMRDMEAITLEGASYAASIINRYDPSDISNLSEVQALNIIIAEMSMHVIEDQYIILSLQQALAKLLVSMDLL